MINKYIAMGRINSTLELESANIPDVSEEQTVLNFSLKVDSKGKYPTYVDCVAWNDLARYIFRNYKKGRVIGIEGELKTKFSEKETDKGRKHTYVVVNQVGPHEKLPEDEFEEVQSIPAFEE